MNYQQALGLFQESTENNPNIYPQKKKQILNIENLYVGIITYKKIVFHYTFS